MKALIPLLLVITAQPSLAVDPDVGPSYPSAVSSTVVGNWYKYGPSTFLNGQPSSVGDPGVVGGEWVLTRFSGVGKLDATWTGCIPTTASSYHFAGLIKPNPAFTGNYPAESPVSTFVASFGTRWETPNVLHVVGWNGSQTTRTEVPPDLRPNLTPQGYCGDYRVTTAGSKATLYINGAKVSTLTMTEPATRLAYFAQAYDAVMTFSKILIRNQFN